MDGFANIAFLQVKQGQDYYVSAGSGLGGNYQFELLCEPQTYNVANDECSGAINAALETPTPFSTAGATNIQNRSLVPPCASPIATLSNGLKHDRLIPLAHNSFLL